MKNNIIPLNSDGIKAYLELVRKVDEVEQALRQSLFELANSVADAQGILKSIRTVIPEIIREEHLINHKRPTEDGT